MPTIRSLEDLQQFRAGIIETRRRDAARGQVQIIVGLGSCGIAAGALETLQAVRQQIDAQQRAEVLVTPTGCIGLCAHEPIVEVIIGEGPRVTYGHVTPAVAELIIQEHILGGRVVVESVIESLPFPTI